MKAKPKKDRVYQSLPNGLRRNVSYDGRLMTNKDFIDTLILKDGFIFLTKNNLQSGQVYVLENSVGRKFRFKNKSEKEYIDTLMDKILEGAKVEMEHKGTIEAIKKPGIKTKDAAAMIAADHIAEKKDYYDELDKAKLEQGGPIQDLSKGTTLQGPSHDNGGIEIQVNGKPVAEAEGGEVVINKKSSKLFCEELSEINQKGGGKALNCDTCEHKDTCEHSMAKGGSLPHDNEYDFIYKTVKDIFGNNLKSFHESEARQNDYPGNRVFVVEPKYSLTIDDANILVENFESRLMVNNKLQNISRLQDFQFFPDKVENKFIILFSKKANINNYLQKGGGITTVNPVSQADDIVQADEGDMMARGGLINRRMKFPKHYKPQEGKYGLTKAQEENLSDYQINKAIEKMIDAKGIDTNNYTNDEKQYLRKYSGYGGIVADEISLEEAKKSLTEFYTPDAIVRKMWALAYKYGFKDGQSILEPSVGTGEFLKYTPAASMATGYEINKYSYSICKILYPQYNFYLQPFENVFIKNRDSVKAKIAELPKYDLVIGNPPYGDVSGFGMGMGEKQYSTAKNWIEYFIFRGLDLTNTGGVLIYIIGTEVANGGTPFLQQGKSKIKEMIAQKADLLDAYRLPNGVFDRTDVLSDILVFKKR